MTGKCRTIIYGGLKVGQFHRKIYHGKRAIGSSWRQLQAYIRAMVAGVEYKPEQCNAEKIGRKGGAE
jgi:hypothetical protein